MRTSRRPKRTSRRVYRNTGHSAAYNHAFRLLRSAGDWNFKASVEADKGKWGDALLSLQNSYYETGRADEAMAAMKKPATLMRKKTAIPADLVARRAQIEVEHRALYDIFKALGEAS